MAYRKNLINIDYHYDDDTGMYKVGEIDGGISGLLPEYIERYGYDGVKDILAQLAFAGKSVIDEYHKIQKNKNDGQDECCKQEGASGK